MSKLRLKETLEERQERENKEKRRAARKKQKQGPQLHFDYENDIEERLWKLSEPTIYRTPQDAGASYVLNDDADHQSQPERKTKRQRNQSEGPSYKQIQKEMEEANFRAKLFDAMDDDEHLDSLEARFNAYHVPDRWQDVHQSDGNADPNHMDEDEYAEWIRRGMWEKRHKAEKEERERKEKERQEKKAQARRAEREQRRMEEEARERYRARETKVSKDAYDAYLSAWSQLAARALAQGSFHLRDIPWPMIDPLRSDTVITKEAISLFLFADLGAAEKPRKQRIREALLIYHPDRFEKWASLLSDDREKTKAREAAGTVSRILNSLAE